MPCRSDHMEPNARELESQRVAEHLLYLADDCEGVICLTPSQHTLMTNAVVSTYGNVEKVDEWTEMLCSTLRQMTEQGLDACVYNGRNPKARALADWWDDHKIWDKEREEAEQMERDHPLAVDMNTLREAITSRKGIEGVTVDGDLEEPELSCTINGRGYTVILRSFNDNDEEL